MVSGVNQINRAVQEVNDLQGRIRIVLKDWRRKLGNLKSRSTGGKNEN